MLRGSRSEGAADLAVELTLEPDAAGTVPERSHLARHAAEPGRRADDDAVITGEFAHILEHRMAVIGDEAGRLRHFERRRLRHAADVHLGAGAARAFGHGVSHLREVAIGRVIENEDLRHDASLPDYSLSTRTSSASW